MRSERETHVGKECSARTRRPRTQFDGADYAPGTRKAEVSLVEARDKGGMDNALCYQGIYEEAKANAIEMAPRHRVPRRPETETQDQRDEDNIGDGEAYDKVTARISVCELPS